MKRQTVGPVWGELDKQLPGVANWSYYLHLMRTIARWKDLFEDYNEKGNFLTKINLASIFPKRHRLGPQNGSRSLGPKKLLKIVNCAIIKETEKMKETVVGVQMG